MNNNQLFDYCQTEFKAVRESLERIEDKIGGRIDKQDDRMDKQDVRIGVVEAKTNKATGAWKMIVLLASVATAVAACAKLIIGI